MRESVNRWVCLAAGIGVAAAAAGQETKDGGLPVWKGEGAYTIVTTTGMITDTVRNIVGEGTEDAPARAEVIGLMGSGVDPHLYKPTRSDMVTMSRADVILYNGLLLEGKMTDALIKVARSGKPVYAVTEEIAESSLLEPEQMQGHYDPHVWMDPATWRGVAKVVADRLSAFDPDGAGTYEANFRAYDARLAALDSWAEAALETVPEDSRVLVTAHDAFNYFGRRFGYEVVGIQGISTESEAGVKDIETIVDLLVERKVGAVFVESTVSERNVKALIAGAKARGHEVKIGGQLYSDAMGEPGTPDGTYVGMIEHNVRTIVEALGGEVPDPTAPAAAASSAE